VNESEAGTIRTNRSALEMSVHWGEAAMPARPRNGVNDPSGPHIGMHLNDIDREMTSLCRCARSVPIFIAMDADLPSLDQLRNNAAECIRLAEAARTSEHKSLFIEMAERWLTLAEHAACEGHLNGRSLFRDR